MVATATLYVKPKRNEWFQDEYGDATLRKEEDETRVCTIDYSRYLKTDTISTSSFKDSGVTTSSPSNTTTTVTFTVTGTDGYTTNTIVTAGGETLEYRYNFVSRPPAYDPYRQC